MGCSASVRDFNNSKEENEPFRRGASKKSTVANNNKGETINTERDVLKNQDDIKITPNALIVENKGTIAKNYTIIEKIGSGTFGKVYKVQHIPTKQLRAMKVVKCGTVNFQDDERTFLKEIEMLSQLDHPNIIKIYEYYSDDLNYYVITELASGGELYEQIYKMKNYNENDAATIMKQLLSAVCYIHSKGIVHRDLKPENILLETNNKGDLSIKIIDFGTSNYYEKNKKLTLKVGTPYYIAPEVLKKEYNNKCDLWSCGCIMYVLLSGSPPFDAPDDVSIMDKVKLGKYNFNGKEWSSVSHLATNLIDKLLIYDYKKRISAEQALRDEFITKYALSRSQLSLLSDEESLERLKKPFENLRKFNAKQKLQQATIAFLVHHVSSTDMVKDLRHIFKELDENGDGTLSYDEIRKGFVKFYKDENIAEKELEEIIKKIDQDGNDCIEYEEFIRATVNLEVLLTERNLMLAFKAFDKNNDSELSHEEIKSALGVLEVDGNNNNDIIKQIISEIDINNDGNISFHEFKQLMIKVLQN